MRVVLRNAIQSALASHDETATHQFPRERADKRPSEGFFAVRPRGESSAGAVRAEMNLEAVHRLKANPSLLEALQKAWAYKWLTVIMRLGNDCKSSAKLDPAEYPDRQAYRRAAAEAHQKLIHEEIGDTLAALRKMRLKLDGGRMSQTVVVKGPAKRILKAMELPGVREVDIDGPIGLPDE